MEGHALVAIHLPPIKAAPEEANPQSTTFSDEAKRMVDSVKMKLLSSEPPKIFAEPKSVMTEKLTVKQVVEKIGARVLHQLIEGYNQTIGAADVRVNMISSLGEAFEDEEAQIGSGQSINVAKTPGEKANEAFATILMTTTRINSERSKGMNSSCANFRVRGMPEMEKLPLNVRGLELNIESSPPSTVLKHILDNKDEWGKLSKRTRWYTTKTQNGSQLLRARWRSK